MLGRKKVAMLVAEFLGTYALVSVVFAIVSRTAFPLFGAMAAGTTLAVMVLVIGPTSGAHINPAVTLGLWSRRKVSALTAVSFITAQMAAGFVALRVNEYLANQPMAESMAKNWDWRIVAAETIGTFIFTFSIAAAVYEEYEEAQLALTIGAALFVGVLVASVGSAGILNPAVALGVNSFSLSYVVGPLVGGVLGMNLYALLFATQKKKLRAR